MNNIPVEKLKLRLLGDPILAAKARPVEQITEEMERISKAMLEIMYKSHGIGLAGNQVGLLQRIVTIDIDPPTDEEGNELPVHSEGEKKLLPLMPITLINPEIVSYSGNLCPFDEGCLSVPDVYGRVMRSDSVVLKSMLLDGSDFVLECGGLLARVVQHELDHLDGIVFVQKVDPDVYPGISKRVEKIIKRNGPRGFKVRRLV